MNIFEALSENGAFKAAKAVHDDFEAANNNSCQKLPFSSENCADLGKKLSLSCENCDLCHLGWCRAVPGKAFANIEFLAVCPLQESFDDDQTKDDEI